MTWVRTHPKNRARSNILSSHSLNPSAQQAHVALYRAVMFGDSPLTRMEREAMAVDV